MNLRNLRYFVGVAETGSVSLTAELLHRSQPAVSRAIQELEAELGVSLFVREGRRITPSAEGWGLLPHARAVLRSADDLGARAHQFASGKVAVLRIGAAASTVESVLPRLIAIYTAAQPSVEVTLTLDSGSGLLAALERGELDAILTREVNNEFLESKCLFPMHVVAVMQKGHPLGSRRILSVEDLQDEGLLLGPKPFTSRMLFDAACRAADMSPKIMLESPFQGALLALAEVGHGVAILPSTMRLAGRSVTAHALRSDNVPIGTWTALVWDRRRRTAQVDAFIQIAAATLRNDYPGADLRLPALAVNR
ncbi:LysR family transcriptional regulator [Caballeronia choica]|uniref:LysR family transcriptional regulator n=1 Tax=Caballeronia choica TaxID=326476 RepID=A0A158KYC7_9BURK|nr:LysR family transcriptional regulator [Caballeronia choica]SAL86124.1 LysR family transcriptional regulator [Caballeronia choica]